MADWCTTGRGPAWL